MQYRLSVSSVFSNSRLLQCALEDDGAARRGGANMCRCRQQKACHVESLIEATSPFHDVAGDDRHQRSEDVPSEDYKTGRNTQHFGIPYPQQRFLLHQVQTPALMSSHSASAFDEPVNRSAVLRRCERARPIGKFRGRTCCKAAPQRKTESRQGAVPGTHP